MDIESQSSKKNIQNCIQYHPQEGGQFGPKMQQNTNQQYQQQQQQQQQIKKAKLKKRKPKLPKHDNVVWDIISTQQEQNFQQQVQAKQDALLEQIKENQQNPLQQQPNPFYLQNHPPQKEDKILQEETQIKEEALEVIKDSDSTTDDSMTLTTPMYQVLAQNQYYFHQDPQNNVTFGKSHNVEEQYKLFRYNLNYDREYIQDMMHYEPDLSDCLKKTQVTAQLRSKMVDWSIEVLGNYNATTTNETFFRAISLMDAYLKNTTKNITDGQLHLIGITCMYISSKLEDIYHITLQDFIVRVSHNKYSKKDIRQQEYDIMQALDFDITFPHSYSFLILFIHRVMGHGDGQYIQNIQETATLALKMTLYEVQMFIFPPSMIALASIIFAIQCYFENQIENIHQNETKQLFFQEAQRQIQSFREIVMVLNMENEKLEVCLNAVKELSYNFDKFFPGLNNIQKFSSIN